MPRGVPKTRPRYDVRDEARKLLEKWKETNPDNLSDFKTCLAAVKATGLKIHGLSLGKVRKEVLGESKDSMFADGDLLSKIGIVSKVATKIGGLAQLKNVISVIEKVREIK